MRCLVAVIIKGCGLEIHPHCRIPMSGLPDMETIGRLDVTGAAVIWDAVRGWYNTQYRGN